MRHVLPWLWPCWKLLSVRNCWHAAERKGIGARPKRKHCAPCRLGCHPRWRSSHGSGLEACRPATTDSLSYVSRIMRPGGRGGCSVGGRMQGEGMSNHLACLCALMEVIVAFNVKKIFVINTFCCLLRVQGRGFFSFRHERHAACVRLALVCRQVFMSCTICQKMQVGIRNPWCCGQGPCLAWRARKLGASWRNSTAPGPTEAPGAA